MVSSSAVVAVSVIYIGVLCCVAYWGDRASAKQKERSARPSVYALALAVYCTSWSFFGSVGFAAVSGFDFIAVYIGPILAFTVAMPLLRKVVRLCKAQNITSVADFIAARYGKNPAVSTTVTIAAIAGTLPYIALQLKAITQSLAILIADTPAQPSLEGSVSGSRIQLTIALALAAFAILFGARQEGAREHHRGLILAVAVESAVKAFAFLAVGGFIVFSLSGGVSGLYEKAMTQPATAELFGGGVHGGTLLTVAFLSFVCAFLLPRQFHVTFVENVSEKELARARWLFPLYLVAINIFVVPVAIAGLSAFPEGTADPDMYILTLPLNAHNRTFTMFAFLGGLSAAMAMVVVETVALSIMVCNDVFVPLVLHLRSRSGRGLQDISRLLMHIRRVSIVAIVLLASQFYGAVGNASLASIGLLSFAGIAQFAPAFFGGMIWRRATARGAIAGIAAGFSVWAYTLLLPSLVNAGALGPALLEHGPSGIALFRPQVMFYLDFDPLTHGVIWSIFFNTLAFVCVSLLRPPEPVERLQASIFIDDRTLGYAAPQFRPWRSPITIEDLVTTVSRYLGGERTERSFAEYARSRGFALDAGLEADIHAVRFTENLLASAIGTASSRLVMSLSIGRRNVGVASALKLLDDASEAIQYNRDFLQTALDHVRQGLAVFDKDMRLICWNRQFPEILLLPPQLGRFGIPLDQIVRHMAAQSSPLRSAGVEEVVTDRIAKYAVTMETFQERVGGGRVIEVRTDAMPQGGIVVTYTDITERENAAGDLSRAKETLERRVASRTAKLTAVNRELEAAKAKADEANIGKTRFLAAASHDILQPLNAARLYTTSLIERSTHVEVSRLGRNIDASLEAVEDILNALLDISRLETGVIRPELATFPVNELFEQLRVDFEPVAKARGLRFKIVPSSAFVRSDRKLLRRIFQNLLSNALKYTEKGSVVLGCRKRGQTLLVEVHDTGPGIAKHQWELIFKEFQRLTPREKGIQGLGLGLSIVERMCGVLDHPLTLGSKVGKGSTFTVSLPLSRWSEVEKPRPFGLRQGAYGDLRGTVVMCLDNEHSILDGMTSLLSGWQCQVLTATGSAGALQQLQTAKLTPDIVISDYHLDDETGIEAIAAILTMCEADLPAIVISADRSAELKSLVSAANLTLLQKPVKPAALRALISRMTLKRHAAE